MTPDEDREFREEIGRAFRLGWWEGLQVPPQTEEPAERPEVPDVFRQAFEGEDR